MWKAGAQPERLLTYSPNYLFRCLGSGDHLFYLLSCVYRNQLNLRMRVCIDAKNLVRKRLADRVDPPEIEQYRLEAVHPGEQTLRL